MANKVVHRGLTQVMSRPGGWFYIKNKFNRENSMHLQESLQDLNVKEAIAAHPAIGEILERYGIGCGKCSIGTCLLREVVAVHFLDRETETDIEAEIKNYLASC